MKKLLLILLVIAGCSKSKGGVQVWEAVRPDGVHTTTFRVGDGTLTVESDLADVYTGDYKRYSQTYAIVDSFVYKQDPNRVIYLLKGDSAWYKHWTVFRVEKNRIRTDFWNLLPARSFGGTDLKTPEDFDKLVKTDSIMQPLFGMMTHMETFVPEAEAARYKTWPVAKIDSEQDLIDALDSVCVFMDASLERLRSWHGFTDDHIWFEYFVAQGQNPYASLEVLRQAQLKYRAEPAVRPHDREFTLRFSSVFPRSR